MTLDCDLSSTDKEHLIDSPQIVICFHTVTLPLDQYGIVRNYIAMIGVTQFDIPLISKYLAVLQRLQL